MGDDGRRARVTYAGSMTGSPTTATTSNAARNSVSLPMAAALACTVVAVALTGAAAPLAIADPGALVRWGVPIAGTVATIAACATIGLLGLASFLMPETTRTTRRITATRLAAVTATVWGVTGLVRLILVFADLAGLPLTSENFFSQLLAFVWQLETTRVLLLSALLALATALGAAMAKGRSAMAWCLTAALTAVVILALTGHAAGSASHEDAVNALAAHLLGAVVWAGGLIGLAAMRGQLGRDLPVTVRRFSTLALWAFALVAISGIQQAWIRLGSVDGFSSGYGAMIVLKALALTALGAIGALHRRRVIGALERTPKDTGLFARLVAVELVLLGAATGLASTLARSAPPVPDVPESPTRILELTGFPDPGPPPAGAWITQWRAEWLFIAIAVVAVGLYAAGVLRLRRRGDDWPVHRTVSWILGWALWIYATCGAPGIWGRVLFSWHMIMHMAVAMIVPLFLVPGAPITLLLRALPARRDKTWGPREFTLVLVHSRVLRVLANPVVAAAIFFFSLAAFYWTPLFELALTTHTGHLLMMAHFLLTGYIFTWVLIGIDPGVQRWSPLMLLVILFATISFHAFFGVALTDSTTLLAEPFFTQLNLPWGPSPLEDQHTAGEIAWGIGEVPTLILAIVVAVQWIRSDANESARFDRKADRDGDAELTAYNAYLARLREHDERTEA